MAADARWYRHLRDRKCIEDSATDLLVLRGDTWVTGDELDREIDTVLRLEALQHVVQGAAAMSQARQVRNEFEDLGERMVRFGRALQDSTTSVAKLNQLARECGITLRLRAVAQSRVKP
ncbi:hypothetical protein [Pseudomonas sp. NyZ201]|uniref:hypothetical protein n=1 Tax=Pseudomonas sp. NyZ201 TaxID=3409857 RepID=UPI003CE7A44E